MDLLIQILKAEFITRIDLEPIVETAHISVSIPGELFLGVLTLFILRLHVKHGSFMVYCIICRTIG